jgi:hypothetical protein
VSMLSWVGSSWGVSLYSSKDWGCLREKRDMVLVCSLVCVCVVCVSCVVGCVVLSRGQLFKLLPVEDAAAGALNC